MGDKRGTVIYLTNLINLNEIPDDRQSATTVAVHLAKRPKVPPK